VSRLPIRYCGSSQLVNPLEIPPPCASSAARHGASRIAGAHRLHRRPPAGTAHRSVRKIELPMTNTPPKLKLAQTAEEIAAATASVEAAVEDIRAGKIVILVDDADRENEGDLCIAAEKVTAEAINFMARYGRGLICLSLTEEQLERLHLSMMVPDYENNSGFGTAFTVSIEAADGVTTGISAHDRARTIRAAVAPGRPAVFSARDGLGASWERRGLVCGRIPERERFGRVFTGALRCGRVLASVG